MSKTNVIDYDRLKARMDAERARRKASAAKLRRCVCDVLKASGVSRVDASYDGSGDSGGISDILVMPATAMDIQAIKLAIEIEDVDRPGAHPRERTMAELLEWLFMDLVCLDFAGWENNDGGRGDISWDIAEDRIEIEHTTYFTESSTELREY